MTNARCLFVIDDEALIVANTGQSFTRAQVYSIVETRLSTKRERRKIVVPKESEVPSRELIKYIRESNLSLYRNHHNRLSEDCDEENSLMLDYGGRGLLELLQNADDGMAPVDSDLRKQMGEKGLGFKSVLEFTNEPEIYSGPFHFRFSAADTATFLVQSKLKHYQPEQHKLVFRIPHDYEPSRNVADLLKEYDTVIRLPFKDEINRNKVAKWLSDFDERILMFCHHIKELHIKIFEQHYLWRIERSGDNYTDRNVVLSEQIGEHEPTRIEYRIWSECIDHGEGKRFHFAEIAIPLDSSRQPVPIDEPTFLYKFFPTEEHVPLRCIVNAAFDLMDNRNHVRKGFANEEDIATLFQRLAERITACGLDPKALIKAFASPDDISDESKVGSWIANIFHRSLSEAEIIPCLGGHRRKPGDVCVWEEQYELSDILDENSEQISEERLVTLDLVQDQDCTRRLIEQFGAEQLDQSDLPNLLSHIRNDSLESCIKIIKILRRLSGHILNDCKHVACWWTRRGKARSAIGPIPLYETSVRLPKWIEADSLNPRLISEVKSEDVNDSGWHQFFKQVIPTAEREQLFYRSLLPSIEKQNEAAWWKRNGAEVLELYDKWCPVKETFDEMSPLFVGVLPSYTFAQQETYAQRTKAAHALRLPTNKGWLPAVCCYAGTDWGCDRSIAAYFRKVSDRGVLKPKKHWPISISKDGFDRWRQILRFAGVSWEPKVVHFTNNQGISFHGHPDYPWGDPVPFSWKDYIKTLQPSAHRSLSYFWRSPSQTGQWQIEHIPECLPREAHSAIKLMRPLAKLIGKVDERWPPSVSRRMQFEWTGDKYQRYGDYSLKSFAFYQFFYSAWIPCKPTLLHPSEWIAPNCAYMPAEDMANGKSLSGLLPHLPKFGQDTDYEYRKYLTQELKIRTSLPHSSDGIWPDWYSALGNAAAQGRDLYKYRETIKKLVQYSLPGSKPQWADKVHSIPCRVISSDGKREEIAFKPKNTVCWIDKPFLSAPYARIALLSRFNIFMFDDIRTGKDSQACFGISPLSEKIKALPVVGHDDPEAESEIKKRYRHRLAALRMVQTWGNKFPLPADLKVRIIDDLRLKLFHEEELLTDYKILHWIDTDKSILIDSRNQYRALGVALADLYGSPAEIIELFLTEETMDEVCDRLRQKGFSLDDLDIIEKDIRAEEGNRDEEKEEDREIQTTGTLDRDIGTVIGPIITPKGVETPNPKKIINKDGDGSVFPKKPTPPEGDPKTIYTPTSMRGNMTKRHHRLISYVINGKDGTNPNENDNDEKEKAARRREIDQHAVGKAVSELSDEYEVTEMPHGNPGYDLIAVSRADPTRKLYIEVKGTDAEWSVTGVGMSREQYDFARHLDSQEGEYWLFVVENARNPEAAKIWRIKNPSVQVDYYQFDHGWKSIAQQETIKPSSGMIVVHGRQRGTISKVNGKGPFTLLKVVYEDGETATVLYRPNEMVLEANPSRSTDDGDNPTHSE